jgi:putative ABC transport system permease protein
MICGALALALATIGLFGLTYLSVSQRTRELGIRAALGATPRRILRLVLGEGLIVSIVGIAFGLAAAAIAARLLSFALIGVSAADPATYVAAALFQVAVAVAACLLPARKATQVDPLVALRVE